MTAPLRGQQNNTVLATADLCNNSLHWGTNLYILKSYLKQPGFQETLSIQKL